MKIIIKISRCFVIAFLSVLILLNGILIVQSAILGQEMPLLFGYSRAVVITGSMEPVIAPGDMIIFHEQDGYAVDDIVVYKSDNYITHRIVAITENGFITQGDANNTDDGEVLREQIIGKVVLIIPKIGYVVEFLKSPFGMLVLIIGLLALIELPNLVGKISKKR